MISRAASSIVAACLVCITGCMTTPDPPNGGNGAVCDAPAEGEAVICLGTNGVLRVQDGGVAVTRVTQDLRDQFPDAELDRIRVAIDLDDVTLADTNGVATTADGTATVLIFWSAEDAPDSCAAAPSFNQFLITVDVGEVVSITPERSALDAGIVELIADGTFGVCVTLTSPIEGDFTIESMNLQFIG